MTNYQKYELKSFPSDQFPKDLSCFKFTEGTYNESDIKEGQVALRVKYVSIDPLLRVWISGAKSYVAPVKPGSSIPGFGLGLVIKAVPHKNKKNDLHEGDWVFGML
jgi:NADPH-dependent curcumin reductase CurA